MADQKADGQDEDERQQEEQDYEEQNEPRGVCNLKRNAGTYPNTRGSSFQRDTFLLVFFLQTHFEPDFDERHLKGHQSSTVAILSFNGKFTWQYRVANSIANRVGLSIPSEPRLTHYRIILAVANVSVVTA